MNKFQHDNWPMSGKRREFGMYNGKPFRTKAQKVEARRMARKTKIGSWKSSAPVSHHILPKGL